MEATKTKTTKAAQRAKPGVKPTRQANVDAVLKAITKARGKATTTAIAQAIGVEDVRSVGNAVRALRRAGKVVKAAGARGNTATYARAPQAAA